METNIYLGISSNAAKVTKKKYGYVLEVKIKGETVTVEGFGEIEATNHRATLEAIVEAMKRFIKPADIEMHSENAFVMKQMTELEQMAENGFKKKNGEDIANKDLWEQIWELTKDHNMTVKAGKHTYSSWMKGELKNK